MMIWYNQLLLTMFWGDVMNRIYFLTFISLLLITGFIYYMNQQNQPAPIKFENVHGESTTNHDINFDEFYTSSLLYIEITFEEPTQNIQDFIEENNLEEYNFNTSSYSGLTTINVRELEQDEIIELLEILSELEGVSQLKLKEDTLYVPTEE